MLSIYCEIYIYIIQLWVFFEVCELPFYEVCQTNVSRIECTELGCCYHKETCYKKAVPSKCHSSSTIFDKKYSDIMTLCKRQQIFVLFPCTRLNFGNVGVLLPRQKPSLDGLGQSLSPNFNSPHKVVAVGKTGRGRCCWICSPP
uniref:Uncharacterized protein n=1 Tax=Naja naja TaxID=35670 RepID=A0A8C6YG93_NAJNA